MTADAFGSLHSFLMSESRVRIQECLVSSMAKTDNAATAIEVELDDFVRRVVADFGLAEAIALRGSGLRHQNSRRRHSDRIECDDSQLESHRVTCSESLSLSI